MYWPIEKTISMNTVALKDKALPGLRKRQNNKRIQVAKRRCVTRHHIGRVAVSAHCLYPVAREKRSESAQPCWLLINAAKDTL